MYNYQLKIAYIGTNYSGFQVQNNAPTIQGELMKVAIKLCGSNVTVTGASRTDSGVHANGQVVLLTSKKQFEPRKLLLAFNANLPDDIRVISSKSVSNDWHPRYQKVVKTYSYLICNGLSVSPRVSPYSYHYKQKLDIDFMKRCAKKIVGTHDFDGFSGPTQVADTTRTVLDISVTKEGEMIHIIVKGDGFLYNMVRIIVGTLIECGIGKKNEKDIVRILETRNRSLAGFTAPAKGLTLEDIEYTEQENKP